MSNEHNTAGIDPVAILAEANIHEIATASVIAEIQEEMGIPQRKPLHDPPTLNADMPKDLDEDERVALLIERIQPFLTEEPHWTYDQYKNPSGWFVVRKPDMILQISLALREINARIGVISSYNPTKHKDLNAPLRLAYHFTLGRTMLTFTVTLDPVAPTIPSITPWFQGADWHEREFREMFAIEVRGHPNPKRLFLDPSIDAGILNTLIPFSSLLHSPGSKTAWEKVIDNATNKGAS